MKPTRFIQKSFAIILLILFVQKIGVELYLHNWLHTANYRQPSPHIPGNNVVGYSCNCIDDFSMPFTETAEPLSQAIFPTHVEFIALAEFSVSSSSIFYHSLRGPPFSAL